MKKIAKNTLFLFASQAAARLAGLIYSIFLARSLGVDIFGVYTFLLVLFYNFIPLADFGIERLVLRDVSRDVSKGDFYFKRLLPLRFILAGVSYLGLLILGFLLSLPKQELIYLFILGLTLFPYNFIYLINSFQNGKEKMEYTALSNVGIILTTLILGVLFTLLGLSFVWIIFAYLLANLALAIIYLIKLRTWGFSLEWVIDWPLFKKFLLNSWPFALLLVISVFYFRESVFLVRVLLNDYFTGIYGSVFRFIEALILLPQSLALALFPLSSKLFSEDKQKLIVIYRKALGILFLFSLPFALVLWFFPEIIIHLTYGDQYLPAAKALSILGLCLILLFVNSLPGNIVQNSVKMKYFLPFVAFYTLLQLGLGLILIPKYLITGAALALLGTEIVGFFLNNLFVRHALKND